MSAKKPRRAYCTGCGHIWPKMHLMRQHRIGQRCGGRFLSISERHHVNELRAIREELLRSARVGTGQQK